MIIIMHGGCYGIYEFIVISIEAYDKHNLRARIVSRLMDGEQVYTYFTGANRETV